MAKRKKPRPVATRLRNLVLDYEGTLKELSERSDVSYDVLTKWLRGEVKTIDLDTAARLHKQLTGEPLI